MATSVTAQPATAARTFSGSFYFWMVLLMAFFVFGGFGMTYWYPLAAGTFPPAPPVVHLHGATYFSWMVLLVAQATLVNVRNVSLHRSLGLFGIALATAVIIMGALITILGASRASGGAAHGIYLGIAAVTGFGLLFTLAIRNARRPDVHRRLILFAMLPLLPPGIHRLYMVPLGLQTFPVVAMYLTLDAMALAIIVHEWRRHGTIGRHTWIGAGWILLQQAVHWAIIDTAFFAGVVEWLGALARYR
ncbi:MAG TPA: hypothetical protein VIN61_07190 [Gammaproteobacteria bacterium]